MKSFCPFIGNSSHQNYFPLRQFSKILSLQNQRHLSLLYRNFLQTLGSGTCFFSSWFCILQTAIFAHLIDCWVKTFIDLGDLFLGGRFDCNLMRFGLRFTFFWKEKSDHLMFAGSMVSKGYCFFFDERTWNLCHSLDF